MKHTIQKKKQEGFTIIEVLIVLAIAGLIMLIVFLAVPALQRNSRNTQAKNEAATLLGSLNEFVNNNNGKLPAVGSSDDTTSDAKRILDGANTRTLSGIDITTGADGDTPDSDRASVRLRAKCDSPTQKVDSIADLTSEGSARQVVIVYLIEDSDGDLYACQEA